MKKIIIFLLFSLALSGCQGTPNLLGYKLKDLTKQNEELISTVVPNNTAIDPETWNQTYYNRKYWFALSYPPIFEVIESETGFINIIYKSKSGNDVFMSIAPQEGKNIPCETDKTEKTLHRMGGIKSIIKNVPFSDGWISRQACFNISGKRFEVSHILSIDAPTFESKNLPKSQNFKLIDLTPEEQKALEELKNYHEKTDKILEDIRKDKIDDLTKKEIALFDAIISTLSMYE